MKIVKRLFTVKLELTIKELADLILVLQDQPNDLLKEIKELKPDRKEQ